MGTVATIIFWISYIIIMLFLIAFLIAWYVLYKADKESQESIITLESYKQKVQQELVKQKDLPYQVYINNFGKLFYEDQQTICLILALNDYYEVYPEKKGQSDIFIDPDTEVCNIIYVGPFEKF